MISVPVCLLRNNVPLVDQFPTACPWRTAWPVQTIAKIEAGAWDILMNTDADVDRDEGRCMLDRAEKCLNCFRKQSAHPTIKRMRKALRVVE